MLEPRYLYASLILDEVQEGALGVAENGMTRSHSRGLSKSVSVFGKCATDYVGDASNHLISGFAFREKLVRYVSEQPL